MGLTITAVRPYAHSIALSDLAPAVAVPQSFRYIDNEYADQVRTWSRRSAGSVAVEGERRTRGVPRRSAETITMQLDGVRHARARTQRLELEAWLDADTTLAASDNLGRQAADLIAEQLPNVRSLTWTTRAV